MTNNIRVTVTKLGQIVTKVGFPTQEEADSWIDCHRNTGLFGSEAVYEDRPVLIANEVRGEVTILISEAELDSNGDEITPALYRIDPDGIISPAIYETRRVLVTPATYEVIVEDISVQIEQERINAEALAFLDSTDWMVVRAMERGEELSPEFKAEREAARARIVR